MSEEVESDSQQPDSVSPPARDSRARGPRSRASRACLSCRARKVRCNVVVCGKPCTNCRLDSVECVTRPRRRTRYPAQVFIHAHPDQPPERGRRRVEDRRHEARDPDRTPPGHDSDHQLLAAEQSPDQKPPDDVEEIPMADLSVQSRSLDPGEDRDEGDLAMLLATLDEKGIASMMGFQDHSMYNPLAHTLLDMQQTPTATLKPTGITNYCDNFLPRSSPIFPDISIPISHIHQISSRSPAVTGSGSFVLFSFYPFLSPQTLWDLKPDDVSLLEQRQCLHLPRKPLLDEFVRQYFLYVHPVLPLINEYEFWKMYHTRSPLPTDEKHISLFVLQTMLFVTCSFVSPVTIRSLGFMSVREARTDFYNKAKLLFDLECTRDDISRAQGALLLTYQTIGISDQTNAFWLSTAIHFARVAHADEYETLDDCFGDKCQLKRLWWCCILRDRIMALGLRRPLHLKPTDFDFTQPGLLETDIQDEIRGSRVYGPQAKRILVQLAVTLCELCVALNDVLMAVHPVKGVSTDDSRHDLKAMERLVTKLDCWYETTMAKFRLPVRISDSHDKLPLFINSVYIFYYTGKACLYNHITLLSADKTSGNEHSASLNQWHASEKVDQSLNSVSEAFYELDHRGLSQYLPITFVVYAALPFIRHTSRARICMSSSQLEANNISKSFGKLFSGFSKCFEITDSVIQYIKDPIDCQQLSELIPVSHARQAFEGKMIWNSIVWELL